LELDCKERVHVYAGYVRHALSQLRGVEGPIKPLVELARAYLSDTEYYLARGDVCTALSCISYSEGVLDALKRLGLAVFEWPKPVLKPRKKVLVGGVFDVLHPGHIYFLRKAAEYGKVYVVVARDSTVIKHKGRAPVLDEKARVEVLNSIKWVEEAFLGEEPPDFSAVLRRVKPDIVFLGADQGWLRPEVERAAAAAGVRVEILMMDKRVGGYSTSKLRGESGC